MIKIGKSADHISVYTCQPKSNKELKEIIEERISKEGLNCDLNDIDTSDITDMCWLFYKSKFNGDISHWNVSKVKTMQGMFFESEFNNNISKWNVSNVKYMWNIFIRATFNKDISNWKINDYCDINRMFKDCPIREEFKPKPLQQK